MNVYRILTTFKQSCSVYLILPDLLFCKITHVCNPTFSFNFFINQAIKIFTTPSFLRQKYKAIIELFYLHHHLHVFLLQKLQLYSMFQPCQPFYTYTHTHAHTHTHTHTHTRTHTDTKLMI